MGTMYPEVHARAHREVVTLLLERSRPDALVLDVGAGEGHLTRALSVAGFRAIAVDPVAGGRTGDVAAARASWTALPFRPGGVDAVVGCASLHYADDVGQAIHEVARVLRPGGLLLVALSPFHRSREGAAIAQETARERTGIPGYVHLVLDEVQVAMDRAGFEVDRRSSPLPAALKIKRGIKRVLGVEQARFPLLVATWDGDRT